MKANSGQTSVELSASKMRANDLFPDIFGIAYVARRIVFVIVSVRRSKRSAPKRKCGSA